MPEGMAEGMTEWIARLRRRPPRETLDWVAEATGPGARVAAVRPLRGGVSNAMHLVSVERAGEARWLVLRRFLPDRLGDGTAAREAVALEALGSHGVPAPRLVAADPDGSSCDVPTLLITRLGGWARLPAQASPGWIDSLAAALVAVHQVPVAGMTGLPDLTADVVARLAGPPPPWYANRPEEDLRLRALAGRHLRQPDGASVLVHNDFWAGNTLRRGHRVVGVVDWSDAGIGHPGMDVGYCAMDLVLSYGEDAGSRFVAAYERLTGAAVADVAVWTLLGALRPTDITDWIQGWLELGLTSLTPELLRRRMAEVKARSAAMLA